MKSVNDHSFSDTPTKRPKTTIILKTTLALTNILKTIKAGIKMTLVLKIGMQPQWQASTTP